MSATSPTTRTTEEESYDAIIVGTGAGGLTAAMVTAKYGLKTLVIEKGKCWGGTTAKSLGIMWVPGTGINQAEGIVDDPEMSRTYLKNIIGDTTAPDVIDAFIDRGPEAIDFVRAYSPVDFAPLRGGADYLYDEPGALPEGIMLETKPVDLKPLGDWVDTLLPPYLKIPFNIVGSPADMLSTMVMLPNIKKTVASFARILQASLKGWLHRQNLSSWGRGLISGLMIGTQRLGVDIRLNTALKEIITTDGVVTGVVVETDGSTKTIHTEYGLILAAGGFGHNEAMRAKYSRKPVGTQWTVEAQTNTGDAINAASDIGAKIKNMEDALWFTMTHAPDYMAAPWPLSWLYNSFISEKNRFTMQDRTVPHTVMVNKSGKRFVNEAFNYTSVSQSILGGKWGHGDGPAENMPAWLIFDQNCRNKYFFAMTFPPIIPFPKDCYRSGYITKASSITELAHKIDVPADSLIETVSRFNGFARNGVDEDFHRGRHPGDWFYGDPGHKPNPCLGELTKAPFYAVQVYPGDLATSGGIVIDGNARALRDNGSAISGLYAAGNTTTALMGHSYPAGGATIANALVFGYIGATDLVKRAGKTV